MSSDSQALASASSRLVERIALRLTLPAVLLAVPILIFLAIFFFYPAINLLFFSLLTQDAKGVVGPPHAGALHALLRGRPVPARVLEHAAHQPGDLGLRHRAGLSCGHRDGRAAASIVSRTIALIVIAPLIVSVVVRS